MKTKIISLIGLAITVTGILNLFENQLLLTNNALTIALQVMAFGLMIWSRVTFGARSFHAAADTTAGGLVTKGPYKWLRHPIYAAIIYFTAGSLVASPQTETVISFLLILTGLSVRMIMEEKSLRETYQQAYIDYSKTNKRIIPFVF